MDPAVIGGIVTSAVGIVAIILHKARCIVRCANDEEQEEHSWSCAAGFTDSPLEPNRQVETIEWPENSVLFKKKP